MKLGLMSYMMAKTWDRPTIYRVMKSVGLDGIEFRTERQHAHGVEPGLTAEARAAIKAEAAKEGITISCIASGCMFHWPEEVKRRAEIENAKKHILLARDLGVKRVRVFPNDTVEGEDVKVTCRRVAESLRELGQYAADYNVDVLLEMHGKLGRWETVEQIIGAVGHPRVGIIWNSQPRDLIDGSLEPVWKKLHQHFRHIHTHEFGNRNFPYGEYLRLLVREGYDGFLSLELEQGATENVQLGEIILGLHKVFFDEVVRSASAARPDKGAKKAKK